MKRITLFFLIAFALLIDCEAQENAKNILDKASAAFVKDNGIKAEFTLEMSEQGRNSSQTKGSICIDKDKFVMATPQSITWFDGKTQWSYLPASEEVNISNPTDEELQSINPYLLLKMYKKGYNLSSGSTKTFQGKPVYEVILTPTASQNGISFIDLYIDKQTFRPLFIEVVQDNGSLYKLTITHYLIRQTFDDKIFRFDKKKYPDVEEIDLR